MGNFPTLRIWLCDQLCIFQNVSVKFWSKNAGKQRFLLEFWVIFLSFRFLEFWCPWVFLGGTKKKPHLDALPKVFGDFFESQTPSYYFFQPSVCHLGLYFNTSTLCMQGSIGASRYYFDDGSENMLIFFDAITPS